MLLHLERWLGRVTALAALTASVTLLALVLLVFTNMALRYAAGVGATWAQELEGMLLAATAMTGIAYAMRHNDHVRIDVFTTNLRRRTRLWLEAITLIAIAVPVLVLLVHYTIPFVEVSYQRGERSPNSGGLQRIWMYKALLLVGFAFLAAETLRQILVVTRKLRFHHLRPRTRAQRRRALHPSHRGCDAKGPA